MLEKKSKFSLDFKIPFNGLSVLDFPYRSQFPVLVYSYSTIGHKPVSTASLATLLVTHLPFRMVEIKSSHPEFYCLLDAQINEFPKKSVLFPH